MANALYPTFKQKLMEAGITMTSDTIKVALIDTGVYTYSASDEFYDDVSAGTIGTPQTLTTPSLTVNVFDADNATFTSVSGNSVEALIIYKDTGTPSTSPVIAYIDTVSSGLPVTPNGGDITITWDSGANKIFAL